MTRIETQYRDRRVTLHNALLTVARTANAADVQYAYLTPLGARQLIDALEPIAAPRVEPALIGAEWLTGPEPSAPTHWRVEYKSWHTYTWKPSVHAPGIFPERGAAVRAMNAYTQGRNTESFRVAAVDAAPTRWRVEYRSYGSHATWGPSNLDRLRGCTFASPAAAWTRLYGEYGDMGAERRRHYRVVAVDA